MSDTAIAEVPAEPVPPIPPGPEAAVELDGSPLEADAPAIEESATGDAETEAVESFDPRVSIPESLGRVRRAILEGLVDGEGAMSVSQLHALMPVGTPRGTAEAAILRELRSGRIERIAPGTYVLAKPKPAKPAEQPKPPPVAPEDEATWFAALEAWINQPESWDRGKLGPRPDEAGRRIPADIVAKGVDRSRKRQERRWEAEAAAAKRAIADQELRTKLLHACNGNYSASLEVDDLAPIKLALELVPLGLVLSAIRSKTDKRMFPGNAPATRWREDRLLREIAESYTRSDIVPRLVDAWSKARSREGRSTGPSGR
jgi:hypothetical protein